MDIQEIYFRLTAEAESIIFEAAVKVLDDYFVPKAKVHFEKQLFQQIVHKGGETDDQFVCTPRQ